MLVRTPWTCGRRATKRATAPTFLTPKRMRSRTKRHASGDPAKAKGRSGLLPERTPPPQRRGHTGFASHSKKPGDLMPRSP
jgi:hypothetical protein